MKTILFVCTGNTCRSPMAAAFFNHLAPEKLNLKAESAGLFTNDGIESPENAVAAARGFGVDIFSHKSSMLTSDMGERAKYIVCITAAHKERMLEKHPEWSEKTMLLSSKHITDPFGGTVATYKKTAKEIYTAVESMLREGKFNGN